MNMSAYKGLWILFTVFVLTPTFILASGVEGLGFVEARFTMQNELVGYYVPEFLAWILSFPVTAMSTLIPGSVSLSTAFGNFIWPWVGPLTVMVFLLTINPPFYKETQSAE